MTGKWKTWDLNLCRFSWWQNLHAQSPNYKNPFTHFSNAPTPIYTKGRHLEDKHPYPGVWNSAGRLKRVVEWMVSPVIKKIKFPLFIKGCVSFLIKFLSTCRPSSLTKSSGAWASAGSHLPHGPFKSNLLWRCFFYRGDKLVMEKIISFLKSIFPKKRQAPLY